MCELTRLVVGIHVVGAGNGSAGVGDVPFNHIEALDGLGRENDSKGHAAGPPSRADRLLQNANHLPTFATATGQLRQRN